MKLLPNTRSGKWAAGLSIGALAVLLLLNLLPDALAFIPDGVKILLFVAALAGFLIAASLGLNALFRQKDRSILVLISIFLGIAVIFFLLVRIFSQLP